MSAPHLPPTRANAQVIRSYGDERVFESVDIDMPATPAPGQVRVAVAAVSVNPVDVFTRRGMIPMDHRFPMVLGWDLAGVVSAVGDDVSHISVGDRVAAMVFQPVDQNGTYRNIIDLDAALIAPVPDGLDITLAAAIPLAALTAAQILDKARLQPGATLLVNAPLGAVGRWVVQLAHRAGTKVVGIADAHRHAEALDLGASSMLGREWDLAELYRTHPAGVDVAVDLVGGNAAHKAFSAVADAGTYVTAVMPFINPDGVLTSARGVDAILAEVQIDRPTLTKMLALVGEGAVRVAVHAILPLTAAADAHRTQSMGGLSGKILLAP